MGKMPAEEVEKDCEDWCFVCKDGGTLIICDHRDCTKVYHPDCVGKDNSFGKSGDQLICKRHTCYLCGKASKLCCFCCPNAVCGGCVTSAGFTRIKWNKGLCTECLDLLKTLEEIQEYDATGDNIDLTDRDTFECLFLEYWEIIKRQEGVSLKDACTADARRKGIKLRYKYDPQFSPSDSEIEETEDSKKMGRKRRMEFMGWGSKPLIDFLTSIGKDIREEMSQYVVESIICDYIREKNLLDHRKKKRVRCDEKLYSIFRRKSVHRNRIYTLLEAHFKENYEQSEEDIIHLEKEGGLSQKHECDLVPCKKHKKERSHENTSEEEAKPETRSTGFASINADNLKLVYLRKGLVEELLKQNENFGDKVVGSFVKVKNDPRDYMQKNLYQILQVTGVERNSTDDDKSNSTLHLSGGPRDVCISKLADSDIREEEIEDLKQKVISGLLRQPAVVEMEQKAKMLHEDITKHWIVNRLSILQKRIDYANEKGWRRELCEYLDERELLKQPAEQERLLRQTPKIIEDVVEVKTGSAASSDSNGQRASSSLSQEAI